MKKFRQFSARARVKGGKLEFASPKFVRGMIQQFDDCQVDVVFAPHAKKKSSEQQGYLWGIVYPLICEHTGYTTNELHDIFKAKFLKTKKVWRGTEMVVVESTRPMRVGEMAEFITNVILEANEMGIEIPPPDKLYQFKDYPQDEVANITKG